MPRVHRGRMGRLALPHGLTAASISSLHLLLVWGETKGSGNAERLCRGHAYRDGITCRWLFVSEISKNLKNRFIYGYGSPGQRPSYSFSGPSLIWAWYGSQYVSLQ